MEFKPKTEEQIQADRCLPAGTYNFEVVDAEETVSAKGNDMIKLTLRIYGEGDKRFTLNDWILEKLEYKLRHFCESTQLLKVYETGRLTADSCIGRAGRVITTVEHSEQYGTQSRVKDYEVGGEPVQPRADSEENPF